MTAKEQWSYEIRHFMNQLKKGNFIFDDAAKAIWVYYPNTKKTNDPRYIVWQFGESRLRDDHLSLQYSPALSKIQLGDLMHICKQHGVDCTNWDIYWQVYGF